jgi:chemotaxis protein methyltransferase CheR
VNVGSLLARHARYRGADVAVVCGAHRFTFAEHYARVNRLANVLRSLGLKQGDALAIILQECLPSEIHAKILATDIHTGTLITATNGLFGPEIRDDVSPYLLDKYFKSVTDGYEIKPEIKRLVTFRQFNLLYRNSFRSDFDIILCRNVLAYYDHTARRQLLEKFCQLLHAGGLLLAGHSEDLAISEDYFKRLEPAVYIKA